MIRTYALALPELRARRQLDRIQAASIPWMSDTDRRTVLSELRRAANADGPAVTPTRAQLAAIGIQVEEVGKDGEPK